MLSYFRLVRFETTMLDSANQVKEFEELFKKKNFKVQNIDYQSWLLYKWDAIGSEKEAFDHVLRRRTPKDLPRKKTRQRMAAPPGAAKYNPTDLAWDDIWKEKLEADKRKRGNNNSNSNSRNKRPRVQSRGSAVAGTEVSVAQDSDQDNTTELPDIPDPTLAAETVSRRNNSNSSRERRARAKSRGSAATRKEVSSVSVSNPQETRAVPLIDEEDESSSNNSNSRQSGDQLAITPTPRVNFLDLFDVSESPDETAVLPVQNSKAKQKGNNSNSRNSSNSTRGNRRLKDKSSALTAPESVSSASSSLNLPEGLPGSNSSNSQHYNINEGSLIGTEGSAAAGAVASSSPILPEMMRVSMSGATMLSSNNGNNNNNVKPNRRSKRIAAPCTVTSGALDAGCPPPTSPDLPGLSVSSAEPLTNTPGTEVSNSNNNSNRNNTRNKRNPEDKASSSTSNSCDPASISSPSTAIIITRDTKDVDIIEDKFTPALMKSDQEPKAVTYSKDKKVINKKVNLKKKP